MATTSTLIRAGQYAQAARQGAVILVALALPRLGLDRGVIGEWEGLLYLGYILGFGWLSGLLQAYLATVRTTRASEVYSRRVLASVAVTAAVLLAVAAGVHDWLFEVLKLGAPPAGWAWFFVFLLVQWPGLFFEQLLQIRGRAGALAGFATFSAGGYVLSVVLPLYFGGELADSLRWLAGFSGLKAVVIVAAGWWLQRAKKGAGPLVQSEVEKSSASVRLLWRTARPLMLYATVGGLVTAFDPWFVNYWYADDESLFALFRYGARDIPFVTAVTAGMVVVVLPQLTETLSGGLAQLKKSSTRLYHWIFGGVLLLMATSPYWWVLAFTDLFAEGLPLFRVFLFITISRLLFPMPVLVALGYTRGLWLFSLSELICNLVLSVLFAPGLGLWGIVLATVVADILNKVVLMYYLWYRAGIGPGRYMNISLFGGYCMGLLLVYWLFS